MKIKLKNLVDDARVAPHNYQIPTRKNKKKKLLKISDSNYFKIFDNLSRIKPLMERFACCSMQHVAFIIFGITTTELK